MTKSLRFICLLVMAAALCLTLSLLSGLLRTRRDLSDTDQALTLSRSAWETTAAEKETLQDELAGVTDSLKEARLTLSESESRAEELRQEIAQLQSDITSLTSSLSQLGISATSSPEE